MADLFTSLGDFLGLNKGKATTDAANKNAAVLSGLDTTGTGYLDQALGNSQSVLDLGKKGANLYSDALGINGPEGNTNATAAFQHSPGYTQAVDAGTQGIERTAAARGGLGGGEVGVDLGKYITGAANDDYNTWLGNLSGYNGMLQTGVADTNGSLGDLLNFKSGIASGQMGANNQNAAGEEAGQGGLWDLLGNVADVAGTAVGAATGLKGLGGPGGGTALAGGAKKVASGLGGYGSGW